MPSSSHTLDRVNVTFDDDHAVADAGLLLPATLLEHLDAEATADAVVSRGYRPGRKVVTVLAGLLAGADCIDDLAVLRSGSTERILPTQVLAPSTIGTWLRSLSFGHVRQLDRLSELLLTRAWRAGAAPGDGLVIDVDSTICQVHGYAKQGAAYGYTRRLGYHPLLATRADTGEVLHTRMRKGSANTSRGAQRFVRETVGRVRRAGATGPLVLRADSGFWSNRVIAACGDHDVRYSITVRQTKAIVAAIDGVDEAAWVDIAYPDGGEAQVAETTLGDSRRLIVRRTRLTGGQAQLWPDWRHHAFVTDRTGTAVELDADHRHHAVCELAIRDLKHGAGLIHCPSGVFNANAAWAVLATLAHNLWRWTAALGGLVAPGRLTVAKTLRRRYLTIPGRITRSARRVTLHLPAGWPWRDAFMQALSRLRRVTLLQPC